MSPTFTAQQTSHCHVTGQKICKEQKPLSSIGTGQRSRIS